MVIELKDNVSIVVKVPVKKSTKPQPPKKAGLPQKQGIRESDFLATPELSQQLIRELDRLQDLDASRRILDATER
jgi:hypothetical protein